MLRPSDYQDLLGPRAAAVAGDMELPGSGFSCVAATRQGGCCGDVLTLRSVPAQRFPLARSAPSWTTKYGDTERNLPTYSAHRSWRLLHHRPHPPGNLSCVTADLDYGLCKLRTIDRFPSE